MLIGVNELGTQSRVSVYIIYAITIHALIGGPGVTGEIVDDIRNVGIVFQDIPYSYKYN